MDFLETLHREWPVIQQAPWTIAGIISLALAIGWAVGRFLAQEKLQILEARIAKRDEEIGALKENLSKVAAQAGPRKARSTSTTYLHLQFFGDERLPTEAKASNIATWYALYFPHAKMIVRDENTETQTIVAEIPRMWAIFMTLDEQAIYREVSVRFSGLSKLPVYEVKQATTRSILTFVSGDIPPGILEIETKL